MLTDTQFAATESRYKDFTTYYGFGFTPLKQKHEAVGAIEYTRLGATRYYIQCGTLDNQIWRNVDRDAFHKHLR